jgi:hypothetical protein
MALRTLCSVGGILLLAPHMVGQGREAPLTLVARTDFSKTQEDEEGARQPANSQTISSATRDFQRAVNGKTLVRNQCRAQGKSVEVEETAEVVEVDKCKVVIKTVKTTHAGEDGEHSSQPAVEFLIHADLSDLTTPVLVETQKFAQCDAGGAGVLRVSSRSDPQKPMQVIRRSRPSAATDPQTAKQTRRDLSLFFADPVAAKKAANALDRAVKACGGKEWPDEDDLP